MRKNYTMHYLSVHGKQPHNILFYPWPELMHCLTGANTAMRSTSPPPPTQKLHPRQQSSHPPPLTSLLLHAVPLNRTGRVRHSRSAGSMFWSFFIYLKGTCMEGARWVDKEVDWSCSIWGGQNWRERHPRSFATTYNLLWTVWLFSPVDWLLPYKNKSSLLVDC